MQTDINAKVAEAIGWKWRKRDGVAGAFLTAPSDVESAIRKGFKIYDSLPDGVIALCSDAPDFSTDLNAAWEAAERFAEIQTPDAPHIILEKFPGGYSATISLLTATGEGSTPAEALCRAILIAGEV